MSEKWLQAENIAKKITILLILTGACVLGVYLIPKVLVLILPFVVAYIISIVASPVTKLFAKIRIPRALNAIISILLVAAVLFGVSAAIVARIVNEVYTFSEALPELYQSLAEAVSNLQLKTDYVFNLVPDEFLPPLSTLLENIGSALSALSASVVEVITKVTINMAKNVPSVIVGIVFSILASYFLIRDKKQMSSSAQKLLGATIYGKVHEIKSDLATAVLAYIKAQGILMSITFVEVFIGLSILRVNYSFLFAAIIAFVDAIPIFGTGTIVIPWAILSLISGNYTLTVGLCVIYVVCLLVRQFLEPKILSSQIGIHPLVTIMSMYIGFRTIGVFGMILGPVIALITKNFIEKHNSHKEDASS